MHIKLDDDQWVAAIDASLGDVFVELSERAHAKARIVTTLMLDRHQLTDRDLDPSFLQQPSAKFCNLIATSRTQEEMMQDARGAIDRYRELVVQEGNLLVSALRFGTRDMSSLDRWLGKVADALEVIGHHSSTSTTDSDAKAIAGWIEELLTARHRTDTVRMADVLEYELLPRLSPRTSPTR